MKIQLLQKDCWDWEKKSKDFKRLKKVPLKKLKRSVPQSLLLDLDVYQADKMLFT